MLAIPSQASGVAERYGLTREELDRAGWAIERDGTRHCGAAAVNRALAELGGGWARLAAAYRLPPVRALEDAVYEVVVRTRHWLGYLTRTPPELGS